MSSHYNDFCLNLEEVLDAAERGIEASTDVAFDAMLGAANAMPPKASEFDRGVAAGVTLERWLVRNLRP